MHLLWNPEVTLELVPVSITPSAQDTTKWRGKGSRTVLYQNKGQYALYSQIPCVGCPWQHRSSRGLRKPMAGTETDTPAFSTSCSLILALCGKGTGELMRGEALEWLPRELSTSWKGHFDMGTASSRHCVSASRKKRQLEQKSG